VLLIVWQFRPAPGREAEFIEASLCAEEKLIGRFRVLPTADPKTSRGR
jgi:hypothetical protein